MGDVKENEDYHEQFKIKVRITAHAYAEEKIHDEYFDYPEYGIAGCTTMGPLDKARGKECEYYYVERRILSGTSDTVIEDVAA